VEGRRRIVTALSFKKWRFIMETINKKLEKLAIIPIVLSIATWAIWVIILIVEYFKYL
jgi:hypothetical protein